MEAGEKCKTWRLEIANLSALNARVFLQDFNAKLFTLNLTAICVWVTQAMPDRLYHQRRRA